MAAIDTAWFHQRLDARSQSVRRLARYLNIDASAASRMLRGERKMSADEQDQVAAFQLQRCGRCRGKVGHTALPP